MNEEGGFILSYRNFFRAIKVIDDLFLPCDIKISCDLSFLIDVKNDKECNEKIFKLNWFFGNVLNNSIIIDSNNNNFLNNILVNSKNDVIMTPNSTTDNIICVLLYNKMNAILNDTFCINTIDIETDVSEGLAYQYIGNLDGILPDSSEWFSEERKYWFNKPWWKRDDATTIDIPMSDKDDINVMPEWFTDFSFVNDLQNPNESEEKNKVIKPNFKPQVINGGENKNE